VLSRVHSSVSTTALGSSATACALVRLRDGVEGAFERGAALLSMRYRRFSGLLVFQVSASLACFQKKENRTVRGAQAIKTRPVGTFSWSRDKRSTSTHMQQ